MPTPDSPTARRDAGFTLPEMLVALAVNAIIVVAIAAAFSTMLKTATQTTGQLSDSKNVVFVQTWIPNDLATAIASFDEADESALRASLAGLTPPITINDSAGSLTGTNVLTIVEPDATVSGSYKVVTYRYEQVDGAWVIRRYAITRPGTATEAFSVITIVDDAAAPPPGWTPGTHPLHAMDVRQRNAPGHPVGEDITITFASNKTFTTGGSGVSAQQQLPYSFDDDFGSLALPSRCGSRIALVVDTSGSIPQYGGAVDTRNAAIGFIDGFVGTPTTVSLNGFDLEGYGMTPGTSGILDGQRAPYVSVLNDTADVQAMRDRVNLLDDGFTYSNVDPNGDGIHWNQYLPGGTNWEDGLHTVVLGPTGAGYGTEVPDLIVFITDGRPNATRRADGSARRSVSAPIAVAAAQAVAVHARDSGSRLVGVMTGSASGDPTLTGYLAGVVGNIKWNGSISSDGTVDVANAKEATLFLGDFDELGAILRSIAIAECGGTVTLQKRIDTGPAGSPNLDAPTSGTWAYTMPGGSAINPLDAANGPSTTFDVAFAGASFTSTVQIVETPVDGYVWDRAECSVQGAPIPSTLNADSSAGVTLTVNANQAVSCLMISRPA